MHCMSFMFALYLLTSFLAFKSSRVVLHAPCSCVWCNSHDACIPGSWYGPTPIRHTFSICNGIVSLSLSLLRLSAPIHSSRLAIPKLQNQRFRHPLRRPRRRVPPRSRHLLPNWYVTFCAFEARLCLKWVWTDPCRAEAGTVI